LCIIILTFFTFGVHGWVERLFAKPIILYEVDGFHYVPKKQALHSIYPINRGNGNGNKTRGNRAVAARGIASEIQKTDIIMAQTAIRLVCIFLPKFTNIKR